MLNIKRREQFMLIAHIRNYSMNGIELFGKILKGAWRGGLKILKALGIDGTIHWSPREGLTSCPLQGEEENT